MASKFARGRHAVAECQRSGQKMRYRDLVEDGHVPGLLVHPDWWEPRHPQEIPPDVTDPVALWRPAPEVSVEDGYGLPEVLDGETAPTTPAGASTGTLAVAAATGDTHIVVETAVKYNIGDWLFIELDATGFHITRIVSTADTPSFKVPFTTGIVSAAAIGNDFHIEADT